MPRKDRKSEKGSNDFSIFHIDDPETFNPSSLENELLELLGTDRLPNDDDRSSEDLDENDPRLLAELEAFVSRGDPEPNEQRLTSVSSSAAVLDEINHRVAVYYSAIENLRSTEPTDSPKLKRYERVIQHLGELATRVSRGNIVSLDELPPLPPPIAAAGASEKTSQAPTANTFPLTNMGDPAPPSTESYTANRDSAERPPTMVRNPLATGVASSSGALVALRKRCQEYKLAAVQARDRGQLARAKELLVASKFIEEMIPKVESGEEPFDPESDMPPPPDEFGSPEEENDEPQPPKKSDAESGNTTGAQAPPPAMLSPVVTAENLHLRAEYYRVLMQQAKLNPADSSKARRYARVLTQYENAVKAFQHGVSSFDYSELPPPPNCPKLARRAEGGSSVVQGNTSSVPAAHDPPTTAGADGRKQRMLTLLKARQAELKAAALTAKESGDMDLARTHLRAALSINPLIESVEAGIPFDLSKLPKAPTAGLSKSNSGSALGYKGPVITGVACDPPMQLQLDLEAAASESDRNRILLGELKSQITEARECAEELSRAGLTELSMKLKELARFGQSSASFFTSCVEKHRPISYSFEWANLPKLNMNHDLGDNVLEVSILRGITFPVPSDVSGPDRVDTQVELQVPFPSSENPQKHSTEWIKHTCDPAYDSVARFQVETRSRSFQFSVKNNRAIKACVYYSRGLFRRPGLLGTASIPLGPLANTATVTHLADLMDGRKAVGGRLEVRIRQRSTGSSPSMERSRTIVAPHDSNNIYSLEVLKDDKLKTEQCLANPEISPAERTRNQSNLSTINRLIEGLERRLSGGNSEVERERYVAELHSLVTQTRRKYDDAKARQDNASMSRYKRRLGLITNELERYSHGSLTASHVGGRSRNR
ncbi:unnamed protein product [Dicrocoelium dendriticum]|nr:unnamed protein product [Dicrocoelium dendriticum]